MVVAPAQPEQMNHHDQALCMLRRLAALQEDRSYASFSFDVPHHRCDMAVPRNEQPMTIGDLSLAMYNELKLSQYIREDDNVSTRDLRRFTLTDRGRAVAMSAHD